LEVLMREKKDLEVKERIMRDSLNGITIHIDHLFAHKVRVGGPSFELESAQCGWPDSPELGMLISVPGGIPGKDKIRVK